jgi:hypothetical protein
LFLLEIHSIHQDKFYMKFMRLLFLIVLTGILYCFSCSNKPSKEEIPSGNEEIPVLDGNWWQIAGNPDLGELTSEKQQPVDFGIWKAADGTWQLWSCIRHTKEIGHTRLFHRWEGDSLTQKNWKPLGIAMRADTTLGESPGGMQAPYVFHFRNKYLMFYGDWNRICLAESEDGILFSRVIRHGSPALFGDPEETNTRDAMVLNINNKWYCYYTAHPDNDGAIYVRTSNDLYNWSDSKRVSHGGSPGSGKLWLAECPHVVVRQGKYYLFRTYSYGRYENGKQLIEPKTNIYCSNDPENFGIGTDSLLAGQLPVAAPEIIFDDGQWYIAALMPDLQGIRVARLEWIER